MYDNEVEAVCNICKDTFYVERSVFTDIMDKIVGICEDCHEHYVNGNAMPSDYIYGRSSDRLRT